MPNTDVVVEREMRAPPERAWALISDVTRMGEWSPETRSCAWLGRASGPAVGARFRGRNAHRGRMWFTTCEVTECAPGRAFAFEVTAGPLKIARWRYEFEPTSDGCRAVETFTDRRPRSIAVLGNIALGIADRGEHNRATMKATLERLAEAAENA